MLTEDYINLYWKAYRDSLRRFQLSPERTNQSQVYHDAMQAVLDAHRQEIDKEWADKVMEKINNDR